MSLYKDASLVMIPSAVKDGKLYSIRPTDGAGDFTFSRGSNLAATRVNASQLIEKGRENLVLQSNQFDTTWNPIGGGSFTSGQSGYDGTNDAWQFDVTTTSNSGTYQVITLSGVATFSAYFKKGTIDKIGFTDLAGVNFMCWFDLTNGTIGQQTGDLIDAQIVSVGNGWYRCSITDIASGNNYLQLKPSNAYSGTSTAGNILIQDAQFELGLVATDYIETGATTAQAGILENTPRFDYSGGATCPSLLLEPSRTNLVTQSEYFNSSYWIKELTSIVSNTTTSPDGTLNADKLVENTGTGLHRTYSNIINTILGDDYTTSVFAKQGERNIFGIQISNGAQPYVWFNLATGEIELQQAGIVGKIEPLINGWYKCTASWNSSSATSDRVFIQLAKSINETTYTGDGTSGIYIYGAQFEAGSYPTSYIPTYGVSQTRAFDDCAVNYTNISDTGGTIFWQGFVDIGVDSHAISLSNSANGNGSNRILFYRSTSDNKVWLYIQSAGVSVKNISLQLPTDSNDKYAVSWATNDFAVYINGAQIYTSSSGAIPTGMQYIQLNEWTNAHTETNVTKQALYFTTRLSNLDLAILTGATTYNTFAEMALALNYTVYE